jgi:Mlc titration factor MtfA (ptsG expression regulator)
MIDWLKRIIRSLLGVNKPLETVQWQPSWSHFLNDKVAFYRVLNEEDKTLFNQRISLFLQTTKVEAGQFEVTDEDRLLVAASAIIPVWGFPRWHYFNLKCVFLLPGAFNEDFVCGTINSRITGMVGTGPMSGKMALSRPDLYSGFENSRDKHNVGIHEFVHLVDMADGECDGYPERFKEYPFSIPWFDMVEKKTREIHNSESNIRNYGATNRAEFFAVTSEYFFERPKMLKQKHPHLFSVLTDFYRQDVMAIATDIKIRKKSPCPCGSGKRYKHCCMPKD